MVEADINVDRSFYNTVGCECAIEFGLRIALGMADCPACRIPGTIALNCQDDIGICSCIIDPSETELYNGYPVFTEENPYFTYILSCVLDTDPNSWTPIAPAIITLSNFRDPNDPITRVIVDDSFEATFSTNDPSRIFTAAFYGYRVFNDVRPFQCCDGDKIASYRAFIGIIMCTRFQTFDVTPIVNTKEDYEILRGLFLGRYMHEEFHDEHIIKRAKTVDTL